jgi:septum formation protein
MRAMRLILASASPRRRELLAAAGIHCDIDPVDVDESVRPGESPEAYVTRLALMKAEAGRVRHPDCAVLGADTTVVLDGEILAKPVDDADAIAMLTRLAGRAHDVLTAVSLALPTGTFSRTERTTVWFTALSRAEIRAYVASGEPRDKAGAYAIQGLASRFVPRIDGSYTNVVGLPVGTVWELLREAGLGRVPAVS